MPLGVQIIGRAVANRCKRGLYAKKTVQFGNRVSEDGGNRTKRKWLPNAHRKRLFSEQLGSFVSFQVTAAALRSIDKAGGLDRYVRKVEGTKEDSQGALEIRNRLAIKAGFAPAKVPKRSEEIDSTKREQKKQSKSQRLHVRPIEIARRKLKGNAQKRTAGANRDTSEDGKSTLGWLRNKLNEGFKWN